ncbi:MAG TPA: SDR family oxidoreductase [Thermomicrobiaceae bacterium]|nr:SDR family oxidoreductase [Thermomicrobiaceae bacterium]
MTQERQVVLITGASRGLGLEIARLFAGRGAGLILTARGEAALAAAARELGALTEVLALPGDVADPQHAARLVDEGLARFGRIDVLLNSASTVGPSPMPELAGYPLDTLAEVFAVNVIAPLHLIQRVLPQMRARGDGVIVNVSSDAAVEAYPGWGGYGASKAALEHLSRVLAAELEGSGVRVYAIDPGDMNTQMHREAEPGVDLSHLPGPELPAPAFVQIITEEHAPYARFEAQKRVAAGLGGAR